MAESDDDNLNASANKIHVQSMASANPYQAPEADNVTRVETGKRGLGVVDWLPAIGAGILAALIVFPTTCMGLLVLSGVRGFKQVLGVVFSVWAQRFVRDGSSVLRRLARPACSVEG